jgi:hypothetical protein
MYVHHGSLLVSRAAEASYERAKSYLGADRRERSLFYRLEHAKTREYHLVLNRHDDDYFDPTCDTIGWDPHSALRTTDGGRQSPALGLGHEVDHAVESRRQEFRLSARASRCYDTMEERRVIIGSERHAARTLGESVRYDHGGRCYHVSSPISR